MRSKKNTNLFLKIFWTGIIIICLVLVWAGLHDIIKGEEDITAEIIAVIVSIAVIIYIIAKFRKIRTGHSKTS